MVLYTTGMIEYTIIKLRGLLEAVGMTHRTLYRQWVKQGQPSRGALLNKLLQKTKEFTRHKTPELAERFRKAVERSPRYQIDEANPFQYPKATGRKHSYQANVDYKFNHVDSGTTESKWITITFMFSIDGNIDVYLALFPFAAEERTRLDALLGKEFRDLNHLT